MLDQIRDLTDQTTTIYMDIITTSPLALRRLLSAFVPARENRVLSPHLPLSRQYRPRSGQWEKRQPREQTRRRALSPLGWSVS